MNQVIYEFCVEDAQELVGSNCHVNVAELAFLTQMRCSRLAVLLLNDAFTLDSLGDGATPAKSIRESLSAKLQIQSYAAFPVICLRHTVSSLQDIQKAQKLACSFLHAELQQCERGHSIS